MRRTSGPRSLVRQRGWEPVTLVILLGWPLGDLVEKQIWHLGCSQADVVGLFSVLMTTRFGSLASLARDGVERNGGHNGNGVDVSQQAVCWPRPGDAHVVARRNPLPLLSRSPILCPSGAAPAGKRKASALCSIPRLAQTSSGLASRMALSVRVRELCLLLLVSSGLRRHITSPARRINFQGLGLKYASTAEKAPQPKESYAFCLSQGSSAGFLSHSSLCLTILASPTRSEEERGFCG